VILTAKAERERLTATTWYTDNDDGDIDEEGEEEAEG